MASGRCSERPDDLSARRVFALPRNLVSGRRQQAEGDPRAGPARQRGAHAPPCADMRAVRNSSRPHGADLAAAQRSTVTAFGDRGAEKSMRRDTVILWLGVLVGSMFLLAGVLETFRVVMSGDGGVAFWFGSLIGGGALVLLGTLR